MRGPLSSRRIVERAGWVPFACVIGVMIMVAVAGVTWTTSPYWGRGNAQAKARNVGVIPTGGGRPARPRARPRTVGRPPGGGPRPPPGAPPPPAVIALAAHLSPHRVDIP